MTNINYKHLHYFWTVAREGSIAAASERLHITPQTISGQLALLEDSLDTQLFDRMECGCLDQRPRCQLGAGRSS